MPAKIIGMIGTQQEGVAVHLIKGQISRQWVIDFTRLHEQWNYDSVLVGYYASAAEGFAIALYAADHTERIKFLIAHRPGSVAPALAARQVATFDQLTQGRMSLAYHRRHQRPGSGQRRRLPAQERPLPARRRISRRDAPALDQRQPDRSPRRVLPPQRRLLRHQAVSAALSRRCSSAAHRRARWRWARRHCDVFAIFGEPLKETRDRVQDFRRRACSLRSPGRLQYVAAADHGGNRRRGLGQGARPSGRCRTQDRQRARSDQPLRRTPARLCRARRRP